MHCIQVLMQYFARLCVSTDFMYSKPTPEPFLKMTLVTHLKSRRAWRTLKAHIGFGYLQVHVYLPHVFPTFNKH